MRGPDERAPLFLLLHLSLKLQIILSSWERDERDERRGSAGPAAAGKMRFPGKLKRLTEYITGHDMVEETATSTSGTPGTAVMGEGGRGAFVCHGLPWQPRNESEIPLERLLRSKILKLSLDPNVWLEDYRESEKLCAQDAIEKAESIMHIDPALRKQRFNLVPKVIPEEEFWTRYFAAVERVRAHVVQDEKRRQAGGEEEKVEEALQALARLSPTTSLDRSKDSDSGRLGALEMSSKQLRHLALALESAKGFRRMHDMSDAGKPTTSNATTGKLGTLRRAMEAGKTMLARKMSGGAGGHERLVNSVWSLFDPDARESEWDEVKAYFPSTFRITAQVPGADPTSFLGFLVAEITKTQKMGEMSDMWVNIIEELRWHWKNLKPIPRVPRERAPELGSCPIHQKLMLLNNCIARKARARAKKGAAVAASEAKLKDGTRVARVGHLTPLEGMTMIETGEPIFVPITQEGSVLTEELMRETEELISKTGTIGPGLQQLHCDMQAFKAANPGSVLSDFVRWYSPSDWIEGGPGEGRLSVRMSEEGNMWTELFGKAKAVPAEDQNPLFDMEYNGDLVVDALCEIAPSDLFEQLFIVAVILRHAILEEKAISVKEDDRTGSDSKVMAAVAESEEFFVSTCCRGMSESKIDKICSAYETVEDFIKNCMPIEHLDEEVYDGDYHETYTGFV